MNPTEMALVGAFLLPVAALVFLRVNAALVFMSLCLGYVLVTFVANDADSLINFLAPDAGSVSASALRLTMLFLPVALTTVIASFSIQGRFRVFLNSLPAAAASLLGILLAAPLLTPGLNHTVRTQPLWVNMTRAQAFIVGTGALISLVFLWSQHRGGRKAARGRHR